MSGKAWQWIAGILGVALIGAARMLFGQVDKRIDSLDRKVDDISTGVTEARERLAGIESKLENLPASVEAIVTRAMGASKP